MSQLFQETESMTLHKRKVTTMLNAIRQFLKEEEGAAAAEYALFLALITVALALTVGPLGTAIGNVVVNATTAIS
jgi:pilus assembly protein Flp/PilA